ncbi:hypothetical protein O6H91_06G146000 [Diphasiastrum complanatum]|uniref:Uncharacterized protein n=1 Tax=Diphasiastrum complanatum TaxID=34168 RepID=A0ACC2DK31_DIPCM|nr:hypothetical protein O6H91_06G146000 [Diphasiastrum complanatum]
MDLSPCSLTFLLPHATSCFTICTSVQYVESTSMSHLSSLPQRWMLFYFTHCWYKPTIIHRLHARYHTTHYQHQLAFTITSRPLLHPSIKSSYKYRNPSNCQHITILSSNTMDASIILLILSFIDHIIALNSQYIHYMLDPPCLLF